jgi:hypothetical protein
MSDQDLQEAVKTVRSLLLPLKDASFSDKLYKVSVYLDSVLKNWQACQASLQALQKEADQKKRQAAIKARIKAFQASLQGSLRFSRLNLDAAMKESLQTIAKKPRSAALPQERKKAEALQKAFDRFEQPEGAMLEHFRSVSDPLDKYLLAGPWGFEYLLKRGADLEAYYRELLPALGGGETAEELMVSSYARLIRAVDGLEETAMKISVDYLEN